MYHLEKELELPSILPTEMDYAEIRSKFENWLTEQLDQAYKVVCLNSEEGNHFEKYQNFMTYTFQNPKGKTGKG